MTLKNDAQLMEMERLMRSAPEPSGLENATMGEGVTIHNTNVESAGHVVMWNTDTHESSIFNMNSVRVKLREVFPLNYDTIEMRGMPAWTATPPTAQPWRGTSTCPLHDDRPERAAYAAFGYPRCNRVNLPNEMEAQEHLRKKHPQTWRMMNESRAEAERKSQAEDRSINRLILATLTGVELEPSPEVMSVSTGGTVSTVIEAPEESAPEARKRKPWTEEQKERNREHLARARAARAAKAATKG